MVVLAPTLSMDTIAPVLLAIRASFVRPTSMSVPRIRASIRERVSMVPIRLLVPACLDIPVRYAKLISMNVRPLRATTVEHARI